MEKNTEELTALLPNIATQMRGLLSGLYLAATKAIPAEDREKDPKLDAIAAVLDQNFYRLLRLVNSMSAAQYLTDDPLFTMRDTNLVRLVSEVCETSGDLAELLGIRLRFVCAAERLLCAVHPAALEQLLYHLLSNALKFTPAGGSVTVELKKSGEQLLLCVSDTGCGITPEQMAHLFDSPTQPPQVSVPPHGLGLGLPLCRAIAERHNGSLTVRSTPGTGSEFTVSLPNRQLGDRVSDVPLVYNSGFNRALLGLADALPTKAYTVRELD